MKKLFQLTTLTAALALPLFAVAQGGIPTGINTSYITPYSSGIIGVINGILVPVLMAIAFIVFLWGVYKYFILGAADETSRTDGRKFTLWGIIGFVIILSLWGIVNLVMGTLGLSIGTVPAYPQIGAGSYVPGGGGGGGTAGIGSSVFASNGTLLGTVNSYGQIVNRMGQTVGNMVNGVPVSTTGAPITGATVSTGGSCPTGYTRGSLSGQCVDAAGEVYTADGAGSCPTGYTRGSLSGQCVDAAGEVYTADGGGAVCDSGTQADCEAAGLNCDASTGTLRCI